MGPRTTTEAAFREILSAYGLVNRFMAHHFAGHGITGAKWGVLRALHRASAEGHTSLRPADLGERLLVRPPSVTTLVRRLADQGLVAVRRGESDHRERLIALTPAGRRLVEEILESHRERVSEAMAGLDESDQARVARLLSRLNTHLRILLDADPPARGGARSDTE